MSSSSQQFLFWPDEKQILFLAPQNPLSFPRNLFLNKKKKIERLTHIIASSASSQMLVSILINLIKFQAFMN
jgi:hypothetical protein